MILVLLLKRLQQKMQKILDEIDIINLKISVKKSKTNIFNICL